MKNVITALLVTTFALGLSSTVRATPCKDIAQRLVVANTFAAGVNLDELNSSQKASLENAANNLTDVCLMGVSMRKEGIEPKTAANVVLNATKRVAAETETLIDVSTMVAGSSALSLGYAFGE